MAAIRASQLAPKEKGKEKADDDLHKSKLGLSQALGKAWRTASAVVVCSTLLALYVVSESGAFFR
jgi:hypothetical protein